MADELKRMNIKEISGSQGEKMQKQTDDLIASLKQNRAVASLLQKKEMPSDIIEKYPWKLKRFADGVSLCSGCEGLGYCRQAKKGYLEDLEYDGIMQSVLSPCRYMKKKLEEEAHLSNYLVSDLPRHLASVSFEGITDTDDEYVTVLGKAMDACSEMKGLYLYGTLGTGKTYLAACACNYHARNGKKVAFVHYPSFCQRMVRGMAEGEYREELGRLMYVPFLVLDDIGAEAVTEWNRDQILLPLLNHRYEENLPVWFTSNEDPDSLQNHFSYTSKGKKEELKAMRIMDRIANMSEAVPLTGENRRNKA